MTRQGTALQGLLAGGALTVAYLLSQSSASVGMAEAVIIESRAADLQALKYFDGKRHYEIKPDPEADGDLLVFVSGAERLYAPGKPPDKVPDRELRGGRLANELWAAFSPLRAMRTLGKLPPERLKQLGLADTTKRLTVKFRGVERKFRLATPPPGAVEPYLLSEDDGTAYMVQRVIMNSFSERALGADKPHQFALNAFDKMVVTLVGKKPIAFKAIRKEGSEIELVPAETLSVNRTSIEQWHAGLFGMPVEDVLGREELPAAGTPQPQIRLEYWLGRDRQGWMDLALGLFRGEQRLYFRTERSFGWMVGVAGAQSLLFDGQKLFGVRDPA